MLRFSDAPFRRGCDSKRIRWAKPVYELFWEQGNKADLPLVSSVVLSNHFMPRNPKREQGTQGVAKLTRGITDWTITLHLDSL